MAKTIALELLHQDREYLKSIIRTRTIQAQISSRAKIILMKADGCTINAIADKLDLNRNSVILCLNKYKEGGVEHAINDAPGRGRNPEITDDEKTWIINTACKRPSEFGYSPETWTLSQLTKHVNESAEMTGYTRLSTISRSKIQAILKEAEIKPHKIRYYCEKRDPDFEAKMHDVLVVYKQVAIRFDENGCLLPDDEDVIHTISYDEKPGIQAISTTGPDKNPTLENGVIMRDYEYVRKGTLSLLAGIDLLSGEAIPLVSETHKSSDFIAFLKLVDQKYPESEKIRLILDNHSAHTSKETRAYLQTKPGRFLFIFTPKHGSWLNLIESFFSKMTRQMLRGLRVKSKLELEERIYKYFKEVNADPVVYRWKYKMDEIQMDECNARSS